MSADSLPNRVFYLVRHAESIGNAENLAGGNFGLSEAGKQQALQLGEAIESLDPPPTHYFCTPAARTQETAEICGKREVAKVVPEFEERNLGDNQTMSIDALRAMSDEALKAKGIQTYGEHTAQVLSGLCRELEAVGEEDVPLFFATGGVIKRTLDLFQN